MDYERLGLKAGLEIHQQLDTKRKLFCNCPTELRSASESTYEICRHLQIAESELGEIDRAALEEAQVARRFIYKGYDTTCLVENDEEPPLPLNQEALEIALEVALLLDMTPVDEVHMMRKIVIDGSNTSGFQRTALVASDGKISTDEGIVHIDTLCLEEEAAQKISEDVGGVVYSLDRLGIPLVEIATKADITTPKQARIVAEHLGMILRSTGKVKRGIGTIRQDINISIAEGARVEIKGVQTLGMIETIIEREVLRQVNLLKIKEELKRRGAKHIKTEIIGTKEKKGVFAVRLPKFGGLVGREIQPGRRFGVEFADRAKRFAMEMKLKKKVHPDDCIMFVAGERSKANLALDAIIQRASEALEGIPEETRKALEDGNSAYMRPLPSAARMYPETDVLPVPISKELVKKIQRSLPELLHERKERYIREYGLNDELAGLIACSERSALFERIMKLGISPTLVVRTLTATISELSKDGFPVHLLTEQHLFEVFELISANKMAKEGIPSLLRALATKPSKTASMAVSELGLETLSREDIENLITKIVESKKDFIKERGMDAIKPLMGLIMERVRGKVDGELVSTVLKEKIREV